MLYSSNSQHSYLPTDNDDPAPNLCIRKRTKGWITNLVEAKQKEKLNDMSIRERYNLPSLTHIFCKLGSDEPLEVCI